jgi:carboxypeptidase T
MTRRSLASCIALWLAGVAAVASAAGSQEPAIQALIEFDSMSGFEEFVALPGLDIVKAKPGVAVTIVTDSDQLAELEAMGYEVVVEIPHMQAYYAARIRGDNFGAFHTFSETVDFLDALHASYPSITTDKFSIGTSVEGRTIWAVKISDNPDVDETEPKALFEGLHHAREVITPEVIMHYMTWLCENYGSDPQATHLVDERELFFVPIVNPDGFVYNEDTEPDGGGMWRKNRSYDEGSDCYGVDLNRNYSYQWDYPGGASTDPCNSLYRGPAPLSEPEVVALADFASGREFRFNISFHSVVGAILIPWGYTGTVQTPDDALFREIGSAMAMYNGYEVGQADEVISYTATGTTTDWMYGVLGVPSVCVEVGGSDFWPTESELERLREENLWPQIYVSRIVGPYLAVEGCSFVGGDGDQEPEPGEMLDLIVTVENEGLAEAVSGVTVTLTTRDAYVQLSNAESSLGTIGPRSSVDNSTEPLSFSIDSSVPDGHVLELVLVIEGDGFRAEEEFGWLIGELAMLFHDDMEAGTGNWVESDGSWGLSTIVFHTETNSYTDSPSGNYGKNENTWIELADPIDLSYAGRALLSFWHRVDTEEGYDFCFVEVSPDGGGNWSQIGPRFHGNVPWQFTELEIGGEYCTDDFKLRYRLATDSHVIDDGWYVDDVSIQGPPTTNVAPSAPVLSDPPDGGLVETSTPELTVLNAVDPNGGDVLTYAFAVYSDEQRTNPVASAAGIAEGAGATAWNVDTPLGNGEHWWTAYADDGTERGPLMETGSFTADSSGVDESEAVLSLALASPNPFRSDVELSFTLPARCEAEIAVYGVDGRLVRTLASGIAGPGPGSVTWNGRDDAGHRVASGLYFVRLTAGGEERRGKLMLLR